MIAAQFVRRVHDTANQEVLEVGGPVEVDAEAAEELFELADTERFEQHVLAAWEKPVQRGPGDTGSRSDVLDGDLGHAPPFATRLGSVEHASLGGVHNHSETVRRLVSHCQVRTGHSLPASMIRCTNARVRSCCGFSKICSGGPSS